MAKSYLDKDGLLYFLQKIRPSSTPSMDGTASTGTSKRFAAEDHVHPSDTSRAPLASPAFTGTPTAPTAATGTSTTQIATTEFVANAVGSSVSGVSDVEVAGTSVVTAGVANLINLDFGQGCGICDTATTSRTKTVTLSGYKRVEGGIVVIRFNNPVDKIQTININDTGAGTVTKDGLTGAHSFPELATDHAVGVFMLISGSYHFIGASYRTASSTRDGLMTIADKTKLDSITMTNGVIDASVLPSFVDDVVEAYPVSGATELSSGWLSETSGGSALTPESGKIYILMADSTSYATNTQFRWSGTAYVKMLDGGVTNITNSEIDTIVAA